ncbi:ABC transporter permease [Clostridium sp. 19966]|uniref:ABC transporter permease n=1 Tax=Clostridium sp. 19966 TaxID=2768166 RepID=UPI0028E048DC|nr:FtsX-like permease family protein [Clostridium sp. 19966]MDT8719340.1 ABC transporter permease [Clostridium sp. 19966]
MITSYKQITMKYLKANKKRALLTLTGIILSVALICTIGLFFKGMQATEIDNAKANYGSYHIAFKNTDDKLFSEVTNNPKVSRYGYYKVAETINLGKNLKLDKLVATNKALDLLPFKLKEGRMPENVNEFAVERWTLQYIDKNAKLGDMVKINNSSYKLVGILENSITAQMQNNLRILVKDNSLSKLNSSLLVEISSKTNLRKAVSELKGLSTKDNVNQNGALLSLEGAGSNNSLNRGIGIVLSIVIGIVVIATIAVIYNSFQISVVERMKEFGLLRAVGTTPKQIRNLVLKEASILAFTGVSLGIILGVLAMSIINYLFKIIGKDSVIATKLVIDPEVLFISLLIGIICVYISALIPAIFAGRISPLMAISSRTAITKGKIKKSNNLIIRKIFGFEGALAAKNIKRNRKRYRITVFSIVISVVLFVTFKAFIDMSLTSTNEPNNSRNISFTLYSNISSNMSKTDLSSISDKIRSLDSVDSVYEDYPYYDFDSIIDPSKEIKEAKVVKDLYKKFSYQGSEKALINSSMTIYDVNALAEAKKHLIDGAINKDDLDKENGVILIKKSSTYTDSTGSKKYIGSTAELKVGDELPVQYADSTQYQTEFGKGKVKTVKILAIISDSPFDFLGSQRGLKFITTDKVIKSLTEKKDISPEDLSIKIKDVNNDKAVEQQLQEVLRSDASLNLYNQIDSNRRTKASELMLEILIYGFITVIALISSVNIVNTLTTGIILRRREFASLKSIGLTQRGLKKMVILEGMLYSIVGTIYGSIISLALAYGLKIGFSEINNIQWFFPWQAMLIALIASLIIGYLAVLSPLSRIKKANLIEAIREE